MRKLFIPVVAAGVFISSCASNPDSLRAADVSPLIYKNYDCEQIGAESARISRKTNELYDSLKKKASADAWQMGVGLVLLWPVLFALEGGDGADATEFKQLKGEYDALQQASIAKRCGLEFRPLDTQLKARAAADEKDAQKSKQMPE